MAQETAYVIVKTYYNSGEASSKKIRVHVLPGQGFNETYNVACAEADRYPNSLLKIKIMSCVS